MIRYAGGKIQIISLEGMREAACECYDATKGTMTLCLVEGRQVTLSNFRSATARCRLAAHGGLADAQGRGLLLTLRVTGAMDNSDFRSRSPRFSPACRDKSIQAFGFVGSKFGYSPARSAGGCVR